MSCIKEHIQAQGINPSQDDILKAKVFKEFEDENSPDNEIHDNSPNRSNESDDEQVAELYSLKDIFVMDAGTLRQKNFTINIEHN